MSAKRRALNINLPEEQYLDLEAFCKETGFSKTQVIMAALGQYLAIKGEERELKQNNPSRRIKTRVVLETYSADEDKQRMASVLLY